MSEKNNCLLCGAELIYYNSSKNVVCEYCKKTFESVVACKNNHYVCDDCHRNAGEEIIKKICIETTEKNPFIIAEKLMKNPSIHMHGPEHHFLVPAVLLTAYYNTKGLFDEKEKKFLLLRKEHSKYMADSVVHMVYVEQLLERGFLLASSLKLLRYQRKNGI